MIVKTLSKPSLRRSERLLGHVCGADETLGCASLVIRDMGPREVLFLIDIAIITLDMNANDRPFAPHYAASDLYARATLIASVAAALLLIAARSSYATRALVQRDKPRCSNLTCLMCLSCVLSVVLHPSTCLKMTSWNAKHR